MGGLYILVKHLKWGVLISCEGVSDQEIFSGIFKFFTVFEKKMFRVFATFTSSDIISFLARLFFPLIYFSQKKTVLQSARTSCYQLYYFHLTLKNIPFFLFSEKIRKVSLSRKGWSIFISRVFQKSFSKTLSLPDRLRQCFLKSL